MRRSSSRPRNSESGRRSKRVTKKTRIVPEHKEEYLVCDWCGEELKDYTTATLTYPDGSEKHFHKMYAGGTKGNVKKPCLDFYEEKRWQKDSQPTKEEK